MRKASVYAALAGISLTVGFACSSGPATDSGSSSGGQGGGGSNGGGSGSGGTSGGGSGGSVGSDAGSGGTSGGSTSGGNGGNSSGTGTSSGSGSGTSSGGTGSGSGGTGGSSDGGDDGGPTGAVIWPSAACRTQTAELLSKMSRQQKAGQMVAALSPTVGDVMTYQPGSAFSGGSDMPTTGNAPADWAAHTDSYWQAAASTPLAIPILYGIDAVHGNNHPTGTVIFPHNVGLASSRDAALVQQVEQVAAMESIATGVTLTYAPMASVAWDNRWGRFYESFSEDVTWSAEMVEAAVRGLQGPMGLGTGSPGIIACAKHWAGDGQGTAGTSMRPGGVVDRSDIRIDQATMEQFGVAPYLPAIRAGLGCVMASDTTWNGSFVTSNSQLLTTMLKGTYGFQGFVITDWNAAAGAGGIEPSINAGVDMLMQPADWQAAVMTIANSTAIPDSRIDDAVTRILDVKCQAGLFTYRRDPDLMSGVGSADHRALGRKAVAQSLVVLQNDNKVLPLSKTSKVWVGGSGGNSLANQCGGWTINWQGDGGKTTGTTIAQAISKVAPSAASMSAADVIVVVLSEKPYAEWEGDTMTLDTLPAADFTLLDQAKATGKPVVAIVVSGRPATIADHLASAGAWVAAWLPGTEGDGVADVLFGDVKPTGKLSHSWPRDDSQANVKTCCNGNYQPLFPLGFGLAY